MNIARDDSIYSLIQECDLKSLRNLHDSSGKLVTFLSPPSNCLRETPDVLS